MIYIVGYKDKMYGVFLLSDFMSAVERVKELMRYGYRLSNTFVDKDDIYFGLDEPDERPFDRSNTYYAMKYDQDLRR